MGRPVVVSRIVTDDAQSAGIAAGRDARPAGRRQPAPAVEPATTLEQRDRRVRRQRRPALQEPQCPGLEDPDPRRGPRRDPLPDREQQGAVRRPDQGLGHGFGDRRRGRLPARPGRGPAWARTRPADDDLVGERRVSGPVARTARAAGDQVPRAEGLLDRVPVEGDPTRGIDEWRVDSRGMREHVEAGHLPASERETSDLESAGSVVIRGRAAGDQPARPDELDPRTIIQGVRRDRAGSHRRTERGSLQRDDPCPARRPGRLAARCVDARRRHQRVATVVGDAQDGRSDRIARDPCGRAGRPQGPRVDDLGLAQVDQVKVHAPVRRRARLADEIREALIG